MIKRESFGEFVGPMEKGEEFPEKISEEKEGQGKQLFHISGWEELKEKEIGGIFTLHPGPQGAEGKGVYFSEKQPRFSAAEGAREKHFTVVVIETNPSKDWWKSKSYVERKFQRPRTWHSEGKSLECRIEEIKIIEGVRYLFCKWKWHEEERPKEF